MNGDTTDDFAHWSEATPSPGGVLPQGIEMAMISGGDHTIMQRWQPEGLADEERRDLKGQRKFGNMLYPQIFARIPLQSPPEGDDSFSPGEAVGAPAP